MKLTNFLVVGLASTATASTWFSKAAYNKWHETELERWLSDHDVPYPSPADRKDLENLVKDNWQTKIVNPATAAGDKAADNYGDTKGWIFDSWTDSSLKSFLDYNGISSPQPRTRDKLLTQARQNYDAIAKKAGEYSAYPGDWLYTSWTESDLKEFLDARGIPAPQPTSRDKLIAHVRRNARLASLNTQSAASQASASYSSGASVASASASSAQASISNALFDSWSDSKLKEFLDKNGIPVPQGSKKNELIALARKNAAKLTGNDASSASASATSGYGAASSKAGNEYARATDDASAKADDLFNDSIDTWGDSRLKAFLDARGVPVPQGSKKNELIKQVRLHKHKAATGYSAWTFDTWTKENLQKYLESSGKKGKKVAQANRDDLIKQAQDQYATASKSGGSAYASATSFMAQQTQAANDKTFDTWSDSDLKSYLDSYGIKNYQGSTSNELRAQVKKNYNHFKYGTSTPQGTIFEQIKGGFQYVYSLVAGGAATGSATASASASSASSVASKSASSAKAEL